MKNRIVFLFIIFFLSAFIFLNMKGSRYTGINYSINKEEISNFRKIKEFYERYYNYKKLVKEITYKITTEKEQILKISEWIYLNIKKKNLNDITIDSHPWTIIERKLGAKDQFSDILSVLLVINNTDSFFKSKINNLGPLTFFNYKDKWSIIDPYYGIYFIDDKSDFCSLDDLKLSKCYIMHLKYNEIPENEIENIFYDKGFKNLIEIKEYYNLIIKEIPTSKLIENTHIYLRGGRSYIQKPTHRLFYQIQKNLNLI